MLAPLAGLFLVQSSPPPKNGEDSAARTVALSSGTQALSPDGKELAFDAEFHGLHRFPDRVSIRFLSVRSGEVRLSVPCPDTRIEDLAWSPDGTTVAYVSHDGAVEVLRSKDGSVEARFATSPDAARPTGERRSIQFVDGGSKLLLAGGAAPVQLRRHEDGTLVVDFLLDAGACASATCVSSDAFHFAVGDVQGCYAVYSARTGAREAGPFHGPEPVNALAFSPDGTRLAAGLGDCRVRVLSLRSSAGVAEYSHCDQDLLASLQIGSVAFRPDGRALLASSFSFYEVRLWDLETGSVLSHFDYSGGNEGAITARFAADPATVVLSTGDVLDAADGHVVRSLSPTRFGETFGS